MRSTHRTSAETATGHVGRRRVALPKLSRWVAGGTALVAVAAGAALVTANDPAEAASSPSGVSMPGNQNGWQLTFSDDFNGSSIDGSKWGVYHGTPKSSTDGGGRWDRGQVTVTGGKLVLEADKVNGQWLTAGVSNARAGAQTYGKYEVRFRADKGNGLAYAILLYPGDGHWPPEVDIAEDGGGNREDNMSTLHYDNDDKQIKKYVSADFSQWHTIGVIWSPGKLQYTLDGKVYGTVEGRAVPSEPMWLGMQSEKKTCKSQYNNCPNSYTPSSVDVEIDWVARWKASSGATGPSTPSTPTPTPTPTPTTSPSNPGPATDSKAATKVVVSNNAWRTSARSLQGTKLTSTAYITALPAYPSSTKRVSFYLDDPNRSRSPLQQEWLAPFDLEGGTLSKSNPLWISGLKYGKHTLLVVTEAKNGSKRTDLYTFYR